MGLTNKVNWSKEAQLHAHADKIVCTYVKKRKTHMITEIT